MNLTDEIKEKIFQQAEVKRGDISRSKYATRLGISGSTYTGLGQGKYSTISDQNWISLARKVGYTFDKVQQWHNAHTPTYVYITTQLEYCRSQSTTGIFCDKAGIGKTFAAKEFADTHPNTVYIDCSAYKNKKNFIYALATGFGMKSEGKTNEILENTISFIKTLDKPLIIMDEFGDLEYGSFLEIKAIYNHLENYCGFYALGADGLKKKIHAGIRNGRVGFAEIYDRFGAVFSSVIPEDPAQADEFMTIQAVMVIRANIAADKERIDKIISESRLSLRKVRKEVQKLKSSQS